MDSPRTVKMEECNHSFCVDSYCAGCGKSIREIMIWQQKEIISLKNTIETLKMADEDYGGADIHYAVVRERTRIRKEVENELKKMEKKKKQIERENPVRLGMPDYFTNLDWIRLDSLINFTKAIVLKILDENNQEGE